MLPWGPPQPTPTHPVQDHPPPLPGPAPGDPEVMGRDIRMGGRDPRNLHTQAAITVCDHAQYTEVGRSQGGGGVCGEGVGLQLPLIQPNDP